MMGLKTALRHSPVKGMAALLLVAGLGLNGIAFMQARAMTHYVPPGQSKTPKPEKLSFIQKISVVLTGVRVPRPVNGQTPSSAGLTYQTHGISLPEGEHLEAWFMPVGGMPKTPAGIVLLFPPYGGSKQSLLAPTKIFHDLGYETLLVDFRGAGGSSGRETTLGVREGEDVAYAVRYVQQQWPDRPIILYGASLGAVSVMRAIAHEGVVPDAVILESPFDNLLNTVRHRFAAAGIPAFPSAELLVFWGGQLQSMDGFSHNPAEYAEAIAAPVLLMHGEADARVHVEDAQSIFERLPGKKDLLFFPTVGHGAFASDDPFIWTKEVQAFLNSLPGKDR